MMLRHSKVEHDDTQIPFTGSCCGMRMEQRMYGDAVNMVLCLHKGNMHVSNGFLMLEKVPLSNFSREEISSL